MNSTEKTRPTAAMGAATQTYCQRAALELAALIRHQQKPRRGTRRDSALLRRCVEQVLGNVQRNVETAQTIIRRVVTALDAERDCTCHHAVEHAINTPAESQRLREPMPIIASRPPASSAYCSTVAASEKPSHTAR